MLDSGFLRVLLIHTASSNLIQIRVMISIELATQLLRTKERDDNDVRIHASHEDADNFAIVVTFGAGLGWRQGESFTNGWFDGWWGRWDQVTQLISSTDSEGTNGSGSQLHQVNGNHTPSTLYTELFEESRRHDGFVADEVVRVEESTTDDGDNDNRESSSEDLTSPSAEGTAGHGTEVRNDLSNGHGVGGETELGGKHGRVEILRAVRLFFVSRHSYIV